ncbi:hypothetical protein [Streptomyces sp. NPDC002644]
MADIATLTVEELRHLRLGNLDKAVADWRVMADKLTKLATGGSGDVSARDLESKAKAADWEGVNATVSREFVTKTAKQFDDAAAEAKDVLGILSDLASQMAKHKESLDTAITELGRRNIGVTGNGTITDNSPSAPSEVTGVVRPSKEEMEVAKQRVTRILWEATETDRIAKDALRAIMKDQHDFSGAGAGSLKEADMRQGQEQAEKWKKDLLSGEYKRWSDEQLEAFNRSLVLHRDNPGFTEAFFTGIGADQTLMMWREIADNDGPENKDRPKLLAKLQDNLSMALANASYGDSPAVEQWKKDLIAAGPRQLAGDLPIGPTGFQVMSSLMQKGRFEDEFLHDYGTALITHEREKFRGSGEPWLSGVTLNYPDDKKNPNDPMSGFLEALGHNPEASLDFFNQETGKDDERISNFEYLVGHEEHGRKWPGNTDGFDNLGHALESATLGYPHDQLDPQTPPLKDPDDIRARDERLALFRQVIEAYGTSDAVEKHEGITPSLTRIAVGHLDTLNYSMADWGGTGDHAARELRFHAEKYRLGDIPGGMAADFLGALAADPDAYNSLSAAQQLYGSSVIASHPDDLDSAKAAALVGVGVHGILDEARMEALGREMADEKEKQQVMLEEQAAWRDFAVEAAVGSVVGVGSSLSIVTGPGALIIPVVLETAGGAVTTWSGLQTAEWLRDNEYDNTKEAVEKTGTVLDMGRHSAMIPLNNLMDSGSMSQVEKDQLIANAKTYYNDGMSEVDTDNVRGH